MPLSIRSFHLLVEMIAGDMTVSVDEKQSVVILDVRKGSAVVAFNDVHNESTKVSITSGKRLIFDDATRTVIFLPVRL